jgi:hypothetical protein
LATARVEVDVEVAVGEDAEVDGLLGSLLHPGKSAKEHTQRKVAADRIQSSVDWAIWNRAIFASTGVAVNRGLRAPAHRFPGK